MKRTQIAPLLMSLLLATMGGLANAQNSAANSASAPTPMQMKMDRSEFIKMFMWDEASEMWVMRPGVQAPEGMKSRAAVKAERDMFLSNNHWDDGKSRWVPLGGTPRDMNTMSREQVKAQTAAFTRTHKWDENSEKWVQINTDRSQ